MNSPIGGWASPTAKWRAGFPPPALPAPAAKPSRPARRAKSSPSNYGWPRQKPAPKKKQHELIYEPGKADHRSEPARGLIRILAPQDRGGGSAIVAGDPPAGA